jgi:hypothetical protein
LGHDRLGKTLSGDLRCHAASNGLLDLNLEVIDKPGGVFLDLAHHGAKHGESFALVLHQRITLSHGAKTNAILQIVHLIEVVSPATIDNA